MLFIQFAFHKKSSFTQEYSRYEFIGPTFKDMLYWKIDGELSIRSLFMYIWTALM